MPPRSKYLAATAVLALHQLRPASASLLGGKINNHAVATVIAAATTTDEGLLACATADAITSSCYFAGSFDLTVPIQTIQQCLCCYSSIELDEIYLSCASYIAYSEPTATEAFSIATSLYDICDLSGSCPVIGAGGGGGGGGTLPPDPTSPDPITPTPTPPAPEPQPTVPPAPEITAPALCTSLASVWQACSKAIPGFSTAPVSELVDCFCYDKQGSYNTDVQDYADGCESWAKTSATSDYEVVTILQTFCDVYAAAIPTAGPGGGGGSGPTPTSTKPFFTGKPTGTEGDGEGNGNGGAFNMGSFGFGGGPAPTSNPGGANPDLGASSAVVVTVTQTPAPRPNGNGAAKGADSSRWGLLGVIAGALLMGF
ncbi:hypothetical protein V8F20_006100 [Naviculisporaceae sp. PSN 640]